MPESMTPLVAIGVIGALFILLLSLLTNNYSLNNIKSKTVGDGQYGTARWATDQEIRKAYVTVPFDVAAVSYTHLRAHETGRNLVCRLLLEKKKKPSTTYNTCTAPDHTVKKYNSV